MFPLYTVAIAISKMFNVSTDMLLVENESVIADDTAKNKDKTDTSSALSNNKSVKRNKLSKKKIAVCILVIVLIAVGGFFHTGFFYLFQKMYRQLKKRLHPLLRFIAMIITGRNQQPEADLLLLMIKQW